MSTLPGTPIGFFHSVYRGHSPDPMGNDDGSDPEVVFMGAPAPRVSEQPSYMDEQACCSADAKEVPRSYLTPCPGRNRSFHYDGVPVKFNLFEARSSDDGISHDSVDPSGETVSAAAFPEAEILQLCRTSRQSRTQLFCSTSVDCFDVEISDDVIPSTPPLAQRHVSVLSAPSLLQEEEPCFTAKPGVDTPVKRYPVERSPISGRVHLLLTPGIRSRADAHQSILYSWKREADETHQTKWLIGTTEDMLGRISSYIARGNDPRASDSFAQDLSEHPELFSWGVIRDILPGEDSGVAETQGMLSHGRENCYNLRLGGGGGKRQPQALESSSFTIDQIVGMIGDTYQSPSSKQIHRIGKKFTIDLTCREKKMKEVIYEFLFDPTGKKEDRIHHPGYTTTTVTRRMSAHITFVNHPHKSMCKSLRELYEEISQHPDYTRVRLFDVSDLLDKGIPLPIVETAYMEFFSRRGETVRNLGCGGKGSVAHGYMVRKPKAIQSQEDSSQEQAF